MLNLLNMLSMLTKLSMLTMHVDHFQDTNSKISEQRLFKSEEVKSEMKGEQTTLLSEKGARQGAKIPKLDKEKMQNKVIKINFSI